MARFFDGDKEKNNAKFVSDVGFIKKTFDSYRRTYESLDKVLNPDVPTENQGANQAWASDATVTAATAGSAQPYTAKYRTNFVQTGSRSLINRMDRSKIKIEVHLDGKNKEQLVKADLIEDFMRGNLAVLDEDVARYGEGTGLTYKVFESIVNRGKAVSFVQMKKVGGVTTPVWETYNPYGCFHTFRSPHFRFGYEVVKAPEEVAEMIEGMEDAVGGSLKIPDILAEASKNQEGLSVIQYWLEESLPDALSVWAGLLVNNEVAYLRETAFKRKPIVITAVNAASSKMKSTKAYGGQAVNNLDPIENHAVPWYKDAENAVGLYNTEYSILLATGALAAFPPVAIKTEDNKEGWIIGGQDIHTPGAKVYLSHQQAIEAINIARGSMQEHQLIVNGLQRELEYVLPPEVRGREPFAGASGYLFDRMEDTQKNMMVNVFKGGSLHLKQGLKELCQQFLDTEGLKIRLNSQYRDGAQMGKFYPRDFSAADFPEAWDFTVVIDPQVAANDGAKVEIARNAVDSGLMSKQTARAQVMKIDHPNQEQDLIDGEKVHDLLMMEVVTEQTLRDEIIELGERIERARREDREDDADEMELDQAGLQAKLKQLQGGRAQGNNGTPPKPGGFSTSTVPSQETSKNPQMAASALGVPSTGMGGQGGQG